MDVFKIVIDYGVLLGVDLIIEVVFESMDVKKEVFVKLDEILLCGVILVINIFYFDVNEIVIIIV